MNRRHFAALAQRQAALASAADASREVGSRRPGIGPSTDPSRRRFLQGGLAAGIAGGLPLLLNACGGNDDEASPPAEKVPRTLFFDLSHVAHQGRPYQLEAGGRTYALTPVAENPVAYWSLSEHI